MDPLQLLQVVVNNPVVRGTVERGYAARSAAFAVRDQVMGILNIPTASDLMTVASRLRSISTRLEMLEDSMTRVDRGIAALQAAESARSESDRTVGV